MIEYTPTTDEVRKEFAGAAYVDGGRWERRASAFDRWLAHLIRENRAIAWDEAVTAAHDRLVKRVDAEGLIDQNALIKRPASPYRGTDD